jgi:hypothetical protein
MLHYQVKSNNKRYNLVEINSEDNGELIVATATKAMSLRGLKSKLEKGYGFENFGIPKYLVTPPIQVD